MSDNVENVKQLQKLNQKIQRSQNSFGNKTDTTSFRRKLQKDLNDGKSLIRTLDASFERQRSNSQAGGGEQKLLRQYDQEKERFEQLNNQVEKQMRTNEPINDGGGGGQYDNDIENGGQDNNNNNNNNNDSNVPRSQTQSLKSLGLEAMDGHLNELEDKNQKVEKIAQDVQDIKQLYQDVHDLVDAQQQDINTIETNVQNVKVNIETGAKHLESAEEQQKAYRRKLCYVLILILILAGIIVGSICGTGACNSK
jgi:t-SNARE complex subunit (syntaxin)